MKILVTGAKGFIGRNLTARLKNIGVGEIYEFDKDSPEESLGDFCRNCDFVFHLAGVNRPEREEEFQKENFGFTLELLKLLENNHNCCPVMLSSSTQAESDTPYGKSKLAGEELLLEYGRRTGTRILIYRFPNVFGKWCRPNYNSVVATFCYNVARGLPLLVNGRDTKLQLVYIDDVVDELMRALNGLENRMDNGRCRVEPVHETTLGRIVDLLEAFRDSRRTLLVPDMMEGSLSKKLYSTYVSYLPENAFAYSLDMHADQRGSFTEILRTTDRGQFSVNISKPGIEKGNHWHDTKNEKFLVVSGNALIQFRKPDSEEIYSYRVSGKKLEIVDIPCGYTHNIINEGDSDLVTFIWCNECFDPEKLDTYPMRVNKE